jgi:RNA polymerase sigma factor (sigma-70 family)
MTSTLTAIAVGAAQFGPRSDRGRGEPSTQFLLDHRDDPLARDALVYRVTPLVRKIASRFRPPRAADYDDMVQVGLIAAADAIAVWDPSRAAFKKHLIMTIHYRIIDYVRMHAHRNERGLDDALSDNSSRGDELLAHVPSDRPGPEEIVLARERVSVMAGVIRRLSPRKRMALLGMTNCKSPREIDPTASENAIYSSASLARKRLKLALEEL